MKSTKILNNYRQFTDDALEGYATSIAGSLTGNAQFPEPTPSVATLNDANKIFSDALVQAKTRHKTSVAVKKVRRTELEQILRDLAHYCSFVAKGDRPMLVSSGFVLSTELRTAKVLGIPSSFNVQPGVNSGSVEITAERAPAARAYMFLYGPSPVENEAWLHTSSSTPYCTIAGLMPGKTYSFRIGVTGCKGQVLYTEPITRIVP